MALSITQAWNETAAFMSRESRLVLPIGFLLIALPGALIQAAAPTPAPNQLPEAGAWLLLIPLAIVATLVGNLAISRLALRGGTSVGEALSNGAARFWVVLVAALLVGLGAAAALLAAAVVALAAGGGAPTPALAVVPLLLVTPALLFVSTRLIVMNPVAAMEPVGPLALLRRSWALTAGHFWKLLGFLLLLLIVALVLSAAIGAVVGSVVILALGQATPGSLPFFMLLIVSALVQTVVSTVATVMIARVYGQLAPPERADVFS